MTRATDPLTITTREIETMTAKATTTTWATLCLSTDAGLADYTPADGTLAECLTDFFGQPIQTVEEAEAWLESCGGYGRIEIDDVCVASVAS